jgi:hypothetical protein
MAVSGAGGWIPSIQVSIKRRGEIIPNGVAQGEIILHGIAQNAPRSLVYSHHWNPPAKEWAGDDFYTAWRRERTGDKREAPDLFAGDLYTGYLMLLAGETVRIDFRSPHMRHLHEIHAKNTIDPTVLRALCLAGINPELLITAKRELP